MKKEKANQEVPKWRQDFPIDLPQDEYVSRRDFTKFLILTSLAFVVGQFWILFINWKRRRNGQAPLFEISRVENLRPGGILLFNYPQQHEPCVLVCLSENRFVAYSQKCTHLSCPVIPRLERREFHCPCHEGKFDLESGRPLAGPPRRALSRIKLQFLNGKIYAAGIEGAV
jgi:nitrite reductase/ring-hydroxylating ferredoxin subunit